MKISLSPERSATQRTMDTALGLDHLETHPLASQAIQLAGCCSPEISIELNAVRMLNHLADVIRTAPERQLLLEIMLSAKALAKSPKGERKRNITIVSEAIKRYEALEPIPTIVLPSR